MPSYGFMAAAWLTLATEVLVMSLSMWIVCSAHGRDADGRQPGPDRRSRRGAGRLAWGLKEAGVPTAAWVAGGGRAVRGLLVALGRSSSDELRALLRRAAGMSDRLHVAVDANVLEAAWGGIPKHLHRIAAELAAAGDRVDLLVNLRRWESPVPGARAVPLRLRGRGLWRDVAVPLWARRHRPDVLWAPETVLPRRIGVPTVVTVHDLAPLIFPGSKPAAVERQFAHVDTALGARRHARDLRVRGDRARRAQPAGGVERRGRDRQRGGRPLRAGRRARPSGAGRAPRSGSRSRSCCTSARSSRARGSTC